MELSRLIAVESFSEGKTMRRIALTVDALKEALHEILGETLHIPLQSG